MNLTKKMITAILVFSLALSLSAIAFADDEKFEAPLYTDMSSVTITKVYTLVGDGKSPAEAFTLQQVGDGIVRDGEAAAAPPLGKITDAVYSEGAATGNGAEAEFTISLPKYDNVGIYEYSLAEIPGTTAGVTYYENTIKLVVTVVNDNDTGKLRIAAVHTESVGDQKSDRFPNTYSAGKLNIYKNVTGNLGDKTKYFTFTVTLTGEEGKTYAESYAVSGGSSDRNPSAVTIGESAVFYLKHDETVTISNLPYGVGYTVTEDTPSDYTLTKSGDTGSVAAASQTASFTNRKGGTPDTGISLDSLPYVLVLVCIGMGAAALSVKKYYTKDR